MRRHDRGCLKLKRGIEPQPGAPYAMNYGETPCLIGCSRFYLSLTRPAAQCTIARRPNRGAYSMRLDAGRRLHPASRRFYWPVLLD